MSIDFQADIQANYVQLSCQGTFSNEALLNVFETALDIAASKGLKAVLVDIRDLDGAPPTTMERFELGVAAAKIQSNNDIRICIAVVGKEPIIDPHRFAETVALNRGAAGKVFTDIENAVAWIEKEVIR